MIRLPDFKTVDFTDGDSVAACSHILLALHQQADIAGENTLSVTPGPMLLDATQNWINRIESEIHKIPAGEIIRSLSGFDLLHLLIIQRRPPLNFISGCCLRAFTQRMKGDTSVNETELFRAVNESIRRNDSRFLGRPLLWKSLTLEKWLTRFSDDPSFLCEPTAETLNIASLILSENLFAFFGSDNETIKKSIAEQIIPLATPRATDTGIMLRSKLTFVRENPNRFQSFHHSRQLIATLLQSLAASPDLHPLDRAAYHIESRLNVSLAEAI